MSLTIKQLRYAATAGRLRSIAAAAAELNISQSSITAGIDALEARLGFSLFVRQPAKGIVPTPAGRQALGMMQEMLHHFANFESDLVGLGGGPTGRLRLGCFATAAPYVLPPILRQLNQEMPEVRVDLLEGDMIMLRDWLAGGEIDVALTYRSSVTPEIDFHPLLHARPYALVPRDDPFSRRPAVRLAQLVRRPMVILDLPYTREYFTSIFEVAGVRPNIIHSTRSAEIVRALVAGGFGFSILNIRSGREDAEDSHVRCIPLADSVRVPELGIAMVKGVRRPRIIQMFVETCDRLRQQEALEHLTVA